MFRKKNIEKYMTFAIPIEKRVITEITKNISSILQIIDSTRFMASSLSNPVKNLLEGIHKIKCKYG